MATDGERIARLEGEYRHLATRADIESLRAELRGMKWLIGVGISIAGIVASIVGSLLTLWLGA
jgi:hypothetical protein